ncbi:ATP-binding cassette domain-containing protein [Streptomyces umbrinus]
MGAVGRTGTRTVLGPSGCGKSTLLNVTAGTIRPGRWRNRRR